MDISTGLTLLAGAVLAIAGGQVQAQFQFRRRLRVSARALFEDLVGQIGACYVERQRMEQVEIDPFPDYEGEERLEVDDEVWVQHRAVVAELRDTETYEAIREAYAAMHHLANYPGRHVVEWEMAQGMLNPSRGIGESSAQNEFYEVRDEQIDQTVEQLAAAARKVGRWAKVPADEVERRISGAKPLENPAAPGYYFETFPFRAIPHDEHGNVLEDEDVIEVHLARSITRRQPPADS